MPWIELLTPVLNQNQKKEVATRLVDAVTNTLRVPKELPGIQFNTYLPENIYHKGEFLNEKNLMYHMTVYLPPVTAEQKKELFRTLTHALSTALNLHEDAQRRVSIYLQEGPMDNYGMGGRPMTEQMAAR